VLDPNSIEIVDSKTGARIPFARSDDFAYGDAGRLGWVIEDARHTAYEIRFSTSTVRPALKPQPFTPRIGTGDLLRYNAGEARPVSLPYPSGLVDLNGDGKPDLLGTWNYAYRPGDPWNGVVCYPRVGELADFRFGDLARVRYVDERGSTDFHHFSEVYATADAADFNGDGLVDLLYVPRNGDQLYFYWNSGDRDPSGLPIFVSAGHVSRQTSDWEACHALDLDSDHFMDVVVGRMWLRQRGMKDGLPDFAPIVTLDVGDVRCFFDVDGDGKYDAIIREPVAGDGLSNYRIAWQRNLGGTPPKFSSAKPLSDINRDDCSPAEVVAVNSGANSGLLVSSSPYSGFELFLKGKTTASFDRIGAAKSVSAVIALGDQASPCVCDWDGDGDLDLLVGDGYGYPRIVINDGNNEKPSYREARRILSGGKPIRLTRNEILDSHNWHDMGYPFPVFVDWDGDGLPDLMLPNETNRIFWHKNIGTRERPEFGPRQQVICDGFPDSPERRAKSGALADNRDTPNQPYPYEEDQPFFWRTGVAFADFDGDGLMDLVTDDGQHRQATLFVQYRDKSDQLKLRKESTLKLTDGRPIEQSLVQGSRGWAESFRATDWDGDGRIDLVYSIGGKPAGGSIQLLRNVGTRRAPVFDLPKAMCAFGQPINMTNHGPHPWVGDLDGDKLPDVLAYVEASVYCFFCHQAIEMSSPPSYSLRTWVTRERFTEKNISTSGVVKTQK